MAGQTNKAYISGYYVTANPQNVGGIIAIVSGYDTEYDGYRVVIQAFGAPGSGANASAVFTVNYYVFN